MAIYRVSVRLDFSGAGSPGFNIWHCRTENVFPAEDLGDNLANLEAFYTTAALCYPSSTTIVIPDDIVRIDVDPPEGVPFTPVSVVGTGGGPETAELLALGITWKTSVRTRRGLGRTFIGPLRQGMVDSDGTPYNAYVDALQLAVDNLVDAGSTPDANGAWGVYSRVDGVIRDFVSGQTHQDKFSVLRSRRD